MLYVNNMYNIKYMWCKFNKITGKLVCFIVGLLGFVCFELNFNSMIKYLLPKIIMREENMTLFLKIHYNLFDISFNTYGM